MKYFRESTLWDTSLNEGCTFNLYLSEHFDRYTRSMILTLYSHSDTRELLLESVLLKNEYRRSGNFCVIKFLCFKFKKFFFVVLDTHKNFLTVLIDSMFPGLVIWNETAHAKKTWSTVKNCLHAAFMATMQLLVNY